MAVKAQADRRFRRAQVRPARSRRSWRAAGWPAVRAALFLAVLAYAGYRAWHLVFHAQTFRVSRIVVRGNHRLSTGEVVALLEGLRGGSILRADLARWRQRLLRSPWVGEAALRRVLPSTVEVVVAERAPMAIGRLNGTLYLIDARGTVIDEYGPQYAEFDLPIVDGLNAGPGENGSSIDEGRAALVARLMDALSRSKDVAQQVSQIDVSDPHDAVVLLEGDPALLHVGEDQFVERLQSYLELAPALRARVPGIDYVDLRFDERVYVRPAGPPARQSPAQLGATGPARPRF